MKKVFTNDSWKRMLTVLTVLVLTMGIFLPAVPARAEGDGIKEAIYNLINKKQKNEETAPDPSSQEADEPAAEQSRVSQSDDEDLADDVITPRAAVPEVSSPYVDVKLPGDAYLTDIADQLAQYYPDIEILAAFHIENANNGRVSVYLKKTPRLSRGDKLELVGLNELQINPRISVSRIAQGQTVVLSSSAVDGFALIIRHPAGWQAAPAEEPAAQEDPVETPVAEEPETPAVNQPEAAEEPAAEQPEAVAEEPVAEQPEAAAEEPAAEQPKTVAEEPAAEQPEAAAEEPAAEQPEAAAEEPVARAAEASFRSISADMGNGAVAVLSGDLPEGVTMKVRLLSVSVVNMINQATAKSKKLKNLYAFDISFKKADGSDYDPKDVSLTMTVRGGKVADALSQNRGLVVSTIPSTKRAAQELDVTLTKDSVSFPFDGAAYCIDALPVSDTPVIPEPDPLNVSIQCSMNGMVLLGDTVTLTSYVDNDCEVLSYLWECDRGSGFEPVDDEVGDSVSFIATLESLSWNWRLTVVAEIVQNPLAIAAN